MGILYLTISTIFAVLGHIFVKKSEGMSKHRFTILALISFLVAILLLSISIKYINMVIAFAICSGFSILFTNLFNIIIFTFLFLFIYLMLFFYIFYLFL